MKISTSAICCDLSDIASQLDIIIEHENFNWVHLDIMDGHFVPRYGVSPELIQSLRKRYDNKITIDTHLMVDDPYSYASVIAPYSDWYIFHYEATKDPMRTLQMLRKSYPNLKIGLAFNVLTPDCCVYDVIKQAVSLGYLDGVLLMGISPGVLGTDSFIETVKARISHIKRYYPKVCIIIDGGCKFHTIYEYSRLGADVCVSGSSMIFKLDEHTNNMSPTDLINFNINRITEVLK